MFNDRGDITCNIAFIIEVDRLERRNSLDIFNINVNLHINSPPADL